jgi:hypothetical protein
MLSAVVGELRMDQVHHLLQADQQAVETFATRLATERLPILDQKRYGGLRNHFIGMTSLLLSRSWWLGAADILGRLYEQYAIPKKALGQHLTPWALAEAVVRMQLSDVVDQVKARLQAAYRLAAADGDHPNSPFLKGWEAAFLAEMEERIENDAWGVALARYVLGMIWPYLEAPYRCLEPTLGAGIFVLVAAGAIPYWMLAAGVQA